MRKLILLAATAIALLAFAAPASADPVEVEDRASGVMCDDTTAGHCEIHLVGDLHVVVHTLLGEFSYRCHWELDIRMHSNGRGPVTGVSIYDEESSTCDEDIVPCELPWSAHITHDGAGRETLTIALCLDVLILGTCEGSMHTDLVKTGNDYTFELADAEIEGDANCEFSGDSTFEDPDGVEIHHV